MNYLIEENMWGFRVLIDKRKGLIWGFKEEEKKRDFMVFSGLFEQFLWTLPLERDEEEKKRELERDREKSHKGQHASMLKHSIILLINSSLWRHSAQIYKLFHALEVLGLLLVLGLLVLKT